MEHLRPETLGRLVDEAPTESEKRHLDLCAACAGELEALRDQTEALAQLPDLLPPVGDWEVLHARLVSEGLVRRDRALTRGLATTPTWMRAAAAVLLFVGGGAVGAAVVSRTSSTPAGDALGPAFTTLASRVATSDDAAELVRVTERQYMDALLRYRQMVEAESGEEMILDPESRFAALEYLVAAGQAALRQAPADPFLNGVLASALAERQAALRKISTGTADNWF